MLVSHRQLRPVRAENARASPVESHYATHYALSRHLADPDVNACAHQILVSATGTTFLRYALERQKDWSTTALL